MSITNSAEILKGFFLEMVLHILLSGQWTADM